MLGLGMGEILLIAAVALVVVGPDRLPQLMRYLGRQYGQLRRASDELRRAFVLEADRQDEEERQRRIREWRERAAEERRRAVEATGGVAQEPPAPATPAVERGHEPDEEQEEAPEGPPPGISAEEWAEVPPRVREMLRRTSRGDGGTS